MKKIKSRKWLKITGVTLGITLLLLIVIPLLIPISGSTGLESPKQLMAKNGKVITLAFEGTDGIDTYYTYSPAKEKTDNNFILIHGSLYDSKTFDKVLDYFSSKGNVYAYDQTPYGLSEKLTEKDFNKDNNPYTLNASLIQLETFMNKLNIESATLVGSSYGGVIASEAALKMPQKVKNLILIDAAIFINESMPNWVINLPQVDRLGPLFARKLASGDSFYKSTYYDKSKLTEKRLKENKQLTRLSNWDLAFWEYLKAWGNNPSDVSTKLDQITHKTLVISGKNDQIVPLEQSKKISNSINNSTFRIIENCGHLPHEEKPNDFIEIVDNWLTDIKYSK